MGNMTIRTTGKRFTTFTQVGLATATDVSGSKSRSWLTLKNNSTNPLTVYGCLAAAQANAYIVDILAAASAAGAGDGGSVTLQNYEGPVSVAGTGISYIVTELN